jgi:hypothetical protein
MSAPTASLRVGALVALCVFSLCAVGAVGPATAGDGIADFQFADREVAAEAGETVDLDLVVDSDGGYASGVAALGATIAVDSEYATITDVDHGPWLEDGEADRINRTATISAGRATVRHERYAGRDDDGVTGRDRFVTVTIRIDPETPPSRLVVGLPTADAELVRGFGLRTIQHDGAIVVDGGGRTIEPATAQTADEGGVGVTTADEVGREATNDTTAETTTQPADSDDDGLPGFRIGVTALALLAVSAGLAARQRRPAED